MERVAICDDIEFSRIAYGLWRVGNDDDTSPSRIRAKIEACLELGITTIDQADIYGGYTAEGLLGACLRESPGLRERLENRHQVRHRRTRREVRFCRGQALRHDG